MKVMDKVKELIEAPLSPEELAVRYREICEDPAFARVPGKVEIDLWGRTLMSPPAAPYHGRLQGKLSDKLAALGGEKTIEAPIATPLGLFVSDLAWSSHKSPPGSEEVKAYLAAGAEEVWIAYPRSKR